MNAVQVPGTSAELPDRPSVLFRARARFNNGGPGQQALILLGPGLLIYAIFAVFPFLDVIRLSFLRWDGLSPHQTFVGLENYKAIFTQDAVFWTAFDNTVIWTILSVIILPMIGFALALGLNEQIRGRNTLRALFYLPVIIAPIAVATMWRWMYDPFFGIVNALLSDVGLKGLIQDWLGDRRVALYSVFVAYVWQSVGFSMVLFLAGLQNVSGTLLEAARLDGANRLQSFRYVTLPTLGSTITIVMVLTLINSLRAFDIVYGMTHGGPGQATQLLAFWAFWQSLQLHDFGKGSAIAVVLLAVTAVIVVPYLRWTLRREDARA